MYISSVHLPGRGRAGRHLLAHLRVAVGAEALASVLFGDDHAEEALLPAAGPELLGEVTVLHVIERLGGQKRVGVS